jgi:hypothetical protein
MDWLDNDSHTFEDGFTLEWSVISSLNNTYLYAFCPGLPRTFRIPPTISFETALVDEHHYGPVGFVEPNAIISERSLWGRHTPTNFLYRSAGPFIWLRNVTENQPVCVPKELINVLCTELAGRPRNQLTLTTALSNARQHVRATDIPSRYKPLAVVLCASVAFTRNVELEACILEHHTATSHPIYERLDRILNFRPWRIVPRTAILVTIATIGFLSAFYDYFPNNWAAWPLLVLTTVPWYVLLTTILFFVLPTYVQAMPLVPEAFADETMYALFTLFVLLMYYAYLKNRRNIKVTPNRPQPPLCLAGPRPDVFDVVYVPYYEIYGINTQTPLPPIANRAAYRAPAIPHNASNLVPTLCAMGIVSPLYNPYSYCSNWHNERAFLHLRILRPTHIPDDETQANFEKFVLVNFKYLFPGHFDHQTIFKTTNYQLWLLRFPESTRRLLQLAHESELAGDYINWFHVYRHSAFVKREKSHKDGKPRGITSATPFYNQKIGPTVHAASLYIQTLWTPRHFITYSPGLNSVQIGAWLAMRGVITIVAQGQDYGVFDTTMRQWHQSVALTTSIMLGMSPDAVFHIRKNQSRSYGRTHAGGIYRTESIVNSGDPTTTYINTLFNGLVKAFVICSVNKYRDCRPLLQPPHQQPYSVIAGGDDSLTLRKKSNLPLTPDLEQLLGLNPEYEPCCAPTDSTFLSAVFVPVRVNGDPSYALIPKPGRLLTRFGYSLIPPKKTKYLQYVRGSALGLSHLEKLPIYGSFLRAHLRITHNLKPRHAGVPYQPTVTATITPFHDTYTWFEQRYKIDRQHMADFDALMDSIEHLPALIPSTYFNPFYSVDVGPVPTYVHRDTDHSTFQSVTL